MKIIDVKQGSPEWIACRLGIPTASNFHRIIQSKKLLASAGQAKYIAQLTAEWFLGHPCDDFASDFMERGVEMEAEALRWYGWEKELGGDDLVPAGFCTNDDGTVGASPDQMVSHDGILEIKCPSAVVHMEYLLGGGGVDDDYRCQIQGQLWVTERRWVDILSYHPTFEKSLIRVERDDKFIAALAERMAEFLPKLEAAKARFAEAREVYIDARRMDLEQAEAEIPL